MTLSDMRQLLAGRGIMLTKSLGQNFLHDTNQLERILDAAGVQAGDRVFEIGPGLGPLTALLLARRAAVFAIEIDERLCELLRGRLARNIGRFPPPNSRGQPQPAEPPGGAAPAGRFELRRDDALDFLKRKSRDWSGWKLVANLPYSVASPILVELAKASHPPDLMAVTLQHEVVKRATAEPGTKAYGVLTLLLQLRFEARSSFQIPRTCFFPEPDVDSACLTLVRRSETLLSAAESRTFERVVKRAFSQRRKMMFKLLTCEWPAAALEPAFAIAGIDLRTRAEAVPLGRFIALARALHPTKSPHEA